MKLEIYKEKKTEEVPKVRLKLIEIPGGIDLVAVDENGNMVKAGYLLRLQSDGKIALFAAVSTNLGFQLDNKGKIIISE